MNGATLHYLAGVADLVKLDIEAAARRIDENGDIWKWRQSILAVNASSAKT